MCPSYFTRWSSLQCTSWSQLAAQEKASIQVSEGSLEVDTVKIPYKLWPEPAAFVVEEGVRVYCNKLTAIRPGRSVGVPVRHLRVTQGEFYYVKYKDELQVSGEFLKVVSEDGQLGMCIVSGQDSEEFILQKGQCLCFLFPLHSVNLISNYDTSSYYTVFCTFDISLCLKHLAEPAYSEFYTLFAVWSNV